jgi:hypothetical protein
VDAYQENKESKIEKQGELTNKEKFPRLHSELPAGRNWNPTKLCFQDKVSYTRRLTKSQSSYRSPAGQPVVMWQ